MILPNLTDLPDEELLHSVQTSAILRRYEGLENRVLELIRRYNEKKKECQELRDERRRKEVSDFDEPIFRPFSHD